MKELNDLERRLESWTPRRPSWKVKRRAWAAAASAAGPAGELGVEFPSLRLGWLAPAAMALLLSCVLFNQRSASLFYASGDCGPLVAAAISNQGAATWLPGSFQREQNSLPSENFGWTSYPASTSSVSSLSGSRGTY